MPNKTKSFISSVSYLSAATALALGGCGGGGSGDGGSVVEPPVADSFSVSGSASGLPAHGVLRVSLNGGLPEPVVVDAAENDEGRFTFPDKFQPGDSYQITLASVPARRICEIQNGAGTISADVTDVRVSCLPVPMGPNEYTLSGAISGMADTGDLLLSLNGDELLSVDHNGQFMFQSVLVANQAYQVEIERDPARQSCEIEQGEGRIDGADVADIQITCQPDGSAELFASDRLHKVRVTMTADEWKAFVLDTERARYDNRDAHGWSAWSLWTHSEVYREVAFEYLDEDGAVLAQLDHVGFKMRGNTSRQWPEEWYQLEDGSWTAKPRRFHFTLKFDEKFDEDESVYACIDDSGAPAAIDNPHCANRVSRDVPEVPENDDRSFMDVEKILFKFNKDDPSYQRELLAHEVLNTAGVPTGRMAHASVELLITGAPGATLYGRSLPQRYNMGVFMMDEPIDKIYLKRYFGKNGYLFKVGGGDLAGSQAADPNCVPYEDGSGYVNSNFCLIGVEKSDPKSREEWLGSDNYMDPEFVNSDINHGGQPSQFAPYRPAYDMKSKKKSIAEARVALQDFMLFVQSRPDAVQLAEEFDVDGFIRAQAADIVVGAVDHYVRVANNYYLYLNPLTEKWTYLAYDYDFSFRDNHPEAWGSDVTAFQNVAGSSVFPGLGSEDWRSGRLSSVTPLLWDIVFDEPANQRRLYQEIKRILDAQMDWDGELGTKLAQRRELIEAAVLATDAAHPQGCEQIFDRRAIDANADVELCDAGDVSIKVYIEQRLQTLRAELKAAGIE